MLLAAAIGAGIMFLLGAPIFSVLLAFAIIGGVAIGRGDFMSGFSGELMDIVKLGTSEHALILSTIPLFILAGYIMAEARTAERLVKTARNAVGWIPGGLGIVTIGACTIFTTFTGASGVTIVALGGLLMPALIKEGYPKRFALGLVAGTGSVGLLIVPALPLFVYGTVYGVQDSLAGTQSFQTDRFIFAGLVPAAVLVGILMVYAAVVAIIRKVPTQRFDAKKFLLAFLTHSYVDDDSKKFVTALPETIIPLLVILGIAKGFSINQVASLTVIYVFLLEVVIYRDVAPRALWKIMRDSTALTGAIFIIIFAATAFTNYLVTAGVPQTMVEWVGEHIESKWTFLLALNILLIIVGMLMDIFSAIVVVVPLIAPIARQYGIDPYHLGIIFLLNLEIGYLTPPVGLNLFITAVKFKRPVMEVVRATVPFLLLTVVALGVVTYVPALTVVPEAERTGRLENLANLVKERRRALAYVQEVTLPDGKIKRFDECLAMQPGFPRGRCEDLFAAVTECRKQAGGEIGSECESDAIQEWVTYTTGDLDLDLDLDEDGDTPAGDGDELDPALQELLEDGDAAPAAGGDDALDPELQKLLDEESGGGSEAPAPAPADEDELDPELQKLLEETTE